MNKLLVLLAALALGQGFRMDPFATYLMSDAPMGRYDAYVSTTPSFFI